MSTTGLANAFVYIAKAIEDWDTVRLRELLGLPPHTPLDVLAELLSRLHHLDSRTPEHIEHVLLSSRALPWLRASGQLAEFSRMLPALYAFIEAGHPPEEVPFLTWGIGDPALSTGAN